jgi:hypothetical protein
LMPITMRDQKLLPLCVTWAPTSRPWKNEFEWNVNFSS